MASYIMKTLISNKFDKVLKDFGGDDKAEHNEDNGISGAELLAEQKREAANEKDRQTRRAKIEKEREEARQKIRDKYNIEKKGDQPTKTKNQQQGKANDLTTRIDNVNVKLGKTNGPEPQGFDPVKKTTGVCNSLKQKFGWK